MKQCHIAVFAENADTILSVFNPAVYERLFPGSRLSVQFATGKATSGQFTTGSAPAWAACLFHRRYMISEGLPAYCATDYAFDQLAGNLKKPQMEEFTNVHYVALWGFGIAALFGFVANKTHFCVMGAISDVIHMGSKGRLGAWLLAIGIAVLGTQALQLAGVIDVGESRYLGPSFLWLSYLVGGLLFGIGMTLAAGCGQRNLVRFGAGDLKAFVVLLVMGVSAYMTLRGLFGIVRGNLLDAVSVDLAEHGLANQSMVSAVQSWTGIDNADLIRGLLTALIGGGLLAYALKQRTLRESMNNILAGVVVGACVIAGWYVTGFLGVDDFDPVPVESMSFISSTGNTVNYLMSFTGSTVNFGIAIVVGMIAGSFVYAVISGSLRVETFSNRSEMVRHLVGGALMGFGGVVSVGCTIGQGVTGISSLAMGSLLATVAIVFGSALTMKVEYYLLDEMSFAQALAMALADLVVPGRSESA